ILERINLEEKGLSYHIAFNIAQHPHSLPYLSPTVSVTWTHHKMPETHEVIVKYAYDHISEWYLQRVDSQKSPREKYTKRLLEGLRTSPTILELGCGPGVPILKMLLDSVHE
ncbi:hypothetical protein BDP55DRAFT_754267, partial [Colletotrichum godetiae]